MFATKRDGMVQMIAVRVAVIEDADAIARLTAEVQQLHKEALPEYSRLLQTGYFHGRNWRRFCATRIVRSPWPRAMAKSSAMSTGSSFSALKTTSKWQTNTCTFNKSAFARTSAVRASVERS